MRIARPLCVVVAVGAICGPGACARTGEVLRAGNGGGGNAGNGGESDGGAPVVLHVSDVRLSTGQYHACAVVGGALSCWGDDGDGRLGIAASGSGADQGRVVVVSGGVSWVAPAAGGRHSCGLTTDGEIFCWGANTFGQLGTGDFISSNNPRPVALPNKAVDVRSGFDQTCAVLTDATLWCWGYNFEGQLGLGDQYPGQNHSSPIQVGLYRDWTFVASGQGHTCGIRSPGTLFCWGRNTDLQLGQGSADPEEIRVPIQVGVDGDWVEVACGQGTTCARKRDGSIYCWGSMESGALSVGDTQPRSVPTRVPIFSDWHAVTANAFHTCGLRAAGSIWCAGRDTEGEVGSADLGDAVPSMLQADPNAGWVEVRAGRFFTCGRKADDSLWCLGTNSAHELAAPLSVMRSAVMLRIP